MSAFKKRYPIENRRRPEAIPVCLIQKYASNPIRKLRNNLLKRSALQLMISNSYIRIFKGIPLFLLRNKKAGYD